jgi:hypothetical protein
MSIEGSPKDVDPEELARFENEGGIQGLSYLDAANHIVEKEVELTPQVDPAEEMFNEGAPVPPEPDNGYSEAA